MMIEKVNNLLNNNKNARSQEARVEVINSHQSLLLKLQYMQDFRALHSSDGAYNPYSKLIDEIATWITNGSTNKPKDYKSKLKNENPSEIKPNMKTNNRIYNGKSNYYIKGQLIPTKTELKNKYIRQLVESLKYYQTCYKNRFKVRKAIRDTKNDLNDAIMSFRGINHDGKNNEPNVEPEPLVEPIDLDTLIQDNPIVRDYFNGYTEIETGKRNGISKSSVSRKLKACRKTRLAKN